MPEVIIDTNVAANIAIGMVDQAQVRVKNAQVNRVTWGGIPSAAFGGYKPSSEQAVLEAPVPGLINLSIAYAKGGRFTVPYTVTTTTGDIGGGTHQALVSGPGGAQLTFRLGQIVLRTDASTEYLNVGDPDGIPGMSFTCTFYPPIDTSQPTTATTFDNGFEICCVQRLKLDLDFTFIDGRRSTYVSPTWILDETFPYATRNPNIARLNGQWVAEMSNVDSPALTLGSDLLKAVDKTQYEMSIMYRCKAAMGGIPSMWVAFARFNWSHPMVAVRSIASDANSPWVPPTSPDGGPAVVRINFLAVALHGLHGIFSPPGIYDGFAEQAFWVLDLATHSQPTPRQVDFLQPASTAKKERRPSSG